jgi:hypothetical protein
MLPAVLHDPLQHHLKKVKWLHEQDVEEGFGAVYLPYALARKYPNAARAWGWQCEAGSSKGRSLQARLLPYLPPLLRDASARERK